MNFRQLQTAEGKIAKLSAYLKENFGYEVNSDINAKEALRFTLAKLDETTDAKESARLSVVAANLRLLAENVSDEQVEAAKVIMAAEEVCDRIQKMGDDILKIHVQDLPAMVEAMEAEIGANEAAAFDTAVKGTLESLAAQLRDAKEAIVNATNVAQGEASSTDMDTAMDSDAEDMDMGTDMEAGDDEAADAAFDDLGDDEADAEDIFGGDDAASGEDNSEGRDMKESTDFDSALLELKEMALDGQVSRKQLDELLAKIKG